MLTHSNRARLAWSQYKLFALLKWGGIGATALGVFGLHSGNVALISVLVTVGGHLGQQSAQKRFFYHFNHAGTAKLARDLVPGRFSRLEYDWMARVKRGYGTGDDE